MVVVKCLGSISAFSKLRILAVAVTEQIFHASATSIIIYFLIMYFLNVKNVFDPLKK